MLIFPVFFLHCDWSFWEGYESTNQPSENNGLYKNKNYEKETQPINKNSGNIYVTNTVFKDCSTTEKGGTIFFELSNGKILVEFSTFIDCHAKNNGGSIRATDCDCVVYCICSTGSYTTENDHFLWTGLNKDDRLNYVNSSSACLTPKKGIDTIICIRYGKQICTSVNISYNNVTSYGAIFSNFGSGISYITYCSINSNIASDFYCIYFHGGQEFIIDTCNIINNDIGSGNGKYNDNAVITTHKPTKITNCCILGNTASGSITTQIFYSNSGAAISLYDSCVEGSLSSIAKFNNVTTNSEHFYLHNLKFTSTAEYCYSGIDKVGELTPIPDPTATFMTTKHRRTAKMKDVYRSFRPPFF